MAGGDQVWGDALLWAAAGGVERDSGVPGGYQAVAPGSQLFGDLRYLEAPGFPGDHPAAELGECGAEGGFDLLGPHPLWLGLLQQAAPLRDVLLAEVLGCQCAFIEEGLDAVPHGGVDHFEHAGPGLWQLPVLDRFNEQVP